MRNRAWLLPCVAVIVAVCASTAGATMTITETYTVDPGWEAGGYWEFTVTNHTGADVYMVAVGNSLADFVVVRYPDLVGVWDPNRIDAYDWNVNEFTFRPIAWTAPDLSTFPTSVYFPGATQILMYYVLGSNAPLADGATISGFIFNYPYGLASSGGPLAPFAVGAPFLAFNRDGELVAQGVTNGAPLATDHRTWGAIKALYRQR